MSNQLDKKQYIYSISIIGILFFIFGFVTWLNATLIPYLKVVCQIESETQVYLVTFAFYISYFVTAIPSSWLLKKTGFKKGMSLGLITMGIGALIFIPAAITQTYFIFLIGLFIQGTGLSILQTASNPYITILGPIESAAKRISIMGICNKIAGIISPLILGFIVLKDFDILKEKLAVMDEIQKSAELAVLSSKVIVPYIVMAAILGLLALMIWFSKLPDTTDNENLSVKKTSKKSIFRFTYMWLGVLAIFVYVGAEVISVDTQIRYGEWLGFETSKAKFFASITLVAMIIGYIFGIIAIPKYIKQDKALLIFSILGILFSISAILTSDFISVLSIALLGFANSIMWPSIWPLAIEGLGKYTKIASALLIMGILGGALLPLIYGYLSELTNNQYAYLILIPLYLYLAFFAFKGYKINKEID
jgi:FHS family L-fucose permease-like MFS transporter